PLLGSLFPLLLEHLPGVLQEQSGPDAMRVNLAMHYLKLLIQVANNSPAALRATHQSSLVQLLLSQIKSCTAKLGGLITQRSVCSDAVVLLCEALQWQLSLSHCGTAELLSKNDSLEKSLCSLLQSSLASLLGLTQPDQGTSKPAATPLLEA
ncbi:unnamed protein product, partial [Chrysoparadoxa australica]